MEKTAFYHDERVRQILDKHSELPILLFDLFEKRAMESLAEIIAQAQDSHFWEIFQTDYFLSLDQAPAITIMIVAARCCEVERSNVRLDIVVDIVADNLLPSKQFKEI